MNDETKPAEPATRAVEGEIEVDATPEQVWRALTNATELERWFPLDARVEPGHGGTIYMSWKNEYAGESTILVWDPPRHLRTTWGWSEGGPQQVTDYRIEGRGGKTHLRVVTSGFPSDPSWDGWVEGTRLGWRFELGSLKHYLERHPGESRSVIYLRRRVHMTEADVWERLFGTGGIDQRALGGHAMDVVPPTQYSAIVDAPSDAMLRISAEPCLGEPDLRDVTVWLSAWGDAARDLPSVEGEWVCRLERLFPEGTSPERTT